MGSIWKSEEVTERLRACGWQAGNMVNKGGNVRNLLESVELLAHHVSAQSSGVLSARHLSRMKALEATVAALRATLKLQEEREKSSQHDDSLVPSGSGPTVKRESSTREWNTSPCSPSENDGSQQADRLDTFADSRRKAIECTIVRDVQHLPSFSDIAGLKDAKNALFEALVDPIIYPEYFTNSDLTPWKAVLLFGPPGTGKSAISQAIVKEINSVLYQVSSSDLISSWSGQSEKMIKELFDHAISQKKTTVIFIDEVDSLCRVRSSGEDDGNRRVKTELLVQIQRLQETNRIVLICATNCPWDLDPAFLRRFEKKIYIGLPDTEARISILKKKLAMTRLQKSVSLEWLSERTAGFSGDDLRRFASELAYTQFRYYKEEKRRNSQADMIQEIGRDDVERVLEGFNASVDEKQLARFQQYLCR